MNAARQHASLDVTWMVKPSLASRQPATTRTSTRSAFQSPVLKSCTEVVAACRSASARLLWFHALSAKAMILSAPS